MKILHINASTQGYVLCVLSTANAELLIKNTSVLNYVKFIYNISFWGDVNKFIFFASACVKAVGANT